MAEASILDSTKKALGIAADYDVFDPDILMHINAVFTTLEQLGIGPVEGFAIEDDSVTWDQYLGADLRLNSVKSYVCLRVRLLFDPPATSFAINAIQEQIKELEWRLNVKREEEDWIDPSLTSTTGSIDGGTAGSMNGG